MFIVRIWNTLPPDGEYTTVAKFMMVIALLGLFVGCANLVMKVVLYRNTTRYLRPAQEVLTIVKGWARMGIDMRKDASDTLKEVRNKMEIPSRLEETMRVKTDELKEEIPERVIQKLEEKRR